MVAKVKTAYSFIAATTMLDLKSPMGKAIVGQIHAYSCQSLCKKDAEFDGLYRQVEKEDSIHVLGTGMATSSEGFVPAFQQWLKSFGIEWAGHERNYKIAAFSGNAQNPETRRAFEWCTFLYFDLDG